MANKQHIVSAEDLLSCYYSSVSVVHLPSGGRPTTMHKQIDKLHDRIIEVSSECQKRRDAVSMAWNAATLPLFARKAFAHFATMYDTPFNFSDVWVDIQNFSPGFNQTLFNLARMARGHRELFKADVNLPVDLARFVASCLFLGCARAKQAGKDSASR